jgi:NAD(P)-dependent dehydrogenase (short-subunit alcohol dehydrogenase family)
MISGSSVLHVSEVSKIIRSESYGWKPVDVDIYVHASEDQQHVFKTIDHILRSIYHDYQIHIFRTHYILSWFIINEEKRVIASYQVIMSPCLRWEHVFAGYHTDMVCAGYLCLHQQFVVTSRYTYWARHTKVYLENEGFQEYYHFEFGHDIVIVANAKEVHERYGRHVSYFFPDLVSDRYRDRVAHACEKYDSRKFSTHLVMPFNDLYMADVERSGEEYSISTLLQTPCDAAMFINKLHSIERHGETLVEVYQGERFASIIETMSFFKKCPGTCQSFVSLVRNNPHGYFCNDCYEVEIAKSFKLHEILMSNRIMTALVTGARCGLGRAIKNRFEMAEWKTFGTTRYPELFAPDERSSGMNMLKLDLKDRHTWRDVQKLLEAGEINVLVLSASETLHFNDDDKYKDGKVATETLELDWTNDFMRSNTGIWHKTLDQHSYEEIVSPLMANVAGTAALLSSFIKGVRRIRSIESLRCVEKQTFVCIVVTSFEGRFEEKTPFHPITNACKSALEQIVWTLQPQAKCLDCSIVPSDPGWCFSENAFGKVPGPVTVDQGVVQILEPLMYAFDKRLDYKIYRRDNSHCPQPESFSQLVTCNIKMHLKPCYCVIQYPWQGKRFVRECPLCDTRIESRYIFDLRSQIIFVLVARRFFGLPNDVINIILDHASYPLLKRK